MTYRNEPSAEETEAAALAGMADADKRTWKALKAKLRKGKRSKRLSEDRMVRGPIEDRGRKRGRRG